MKEQMLTKNKSKMNGQKKQQIVFAISFLIIPIVQFLIFYVFVNFKSIMFAFQKFDVFTGGYVANGVANFKEFFTQLSDKGSLFTAFKNSFVLYFWSLLIGMSLALVFSYYVYKKFFGSVFFRIILYLPHIISSVSVVTIYKYFVDGCVPLIWEMLTGKQIEGLLVNLDTQFNTIMFLSIYLGFGTNVLIYTSNMSGISESIVESAELDGITRIKEFVHITVPLIFPSVIDFVLIGIANIFANQMLLYNFYASNAEIHLQTIGYYIYKEVQLGDPSAYPFISAMGLCLTFVLTVVSFFVRWALKKYGPSVD